MGLEAASPNERAARERRADCLTLNHESLAFRAGFAGNFGFRVGGLLRVFDGF